MSLLNTLPYSEYEDALKFSLEMCQELSVIAKLQRNYSNSHCPGEQLMFDLESVGYTPQRYHKLLQIYNSRLDIPTVSSQLKCDTDLKPNCKIAIMIGNEMYKHQYKLKTPGRDCTDIGRKLRELGFIVVILRDVTCEELKTTIESIMTVLPERCYVFLYLAGHGAELSQVRHIFGTEASNDRPSLKHMVSANYLLGCIGPRRPLLCIFIMDVCAGSVEIENGNNLEYLSEVESYNFEGNLIIAYSSSSDQPAYEQVEIECNTDSVSNIKYLDTARHALASAAGSVYAEALKRHLGSRTSVSRILERVTKDVQSLDRKQTPVTIESQPGKAYLFDEICGDHEKALKEIKMVLENGEFKNYTIL